MSTTNEVKFTVISNARPFYEEPWFIAVASIAGLAGFVLAVVAVFK